MLAPYNKHKILVWLIANGYELQPIVQEYYDEYYGGEYNEDNGIPLFVLHYPNKTTTAELTIHQMRMLTAEIYKIWNKRS